MTADERARWCIAQAEAIEAVMRPHVDPHMWDADQMAADFWRDMARRVREAGAPNHPDASRARAFDPWRALGLLLCAASAALVVGAAMGVMP